MKRKQGYYWIKRQGEWCIGYYDGNYWKRIGTDLDYTDHDLEEIDETQILRIENEN